MSEKMKTVTLILLLIGLAGCSKEDILSDWVTSARKPIAVYTNKHYNSVDRDLTLISSDGKIFFLKNTTIVLPDTLH